MKKKSLLKSVLLLFLLLLILNITIPAIFSYSAPVGFVNDFANIIDADYEQKITQIITDIERNTSVEIAVVTIESLEGDSIEYYAVKLFEEWGIGKEKQDNGLLILVALEEKKYRIEVGYGLEGSINDARAGRIARAYFVPNFRNNEYGKGIHEAIQAMKPYITGEPMEEEVPLEQISQFFGFVILSIFYGILLFVYLIKINKKIKKKKGKKSKKLLMALPWIIPFLPLTLLLILFSLTLFITTVFVYIAFASYLVGPKMPRKGRHGPFGPFGGFGGGAGGFKGSSGGGFGGFGGGFSGGGGASGGW